MGEPDIHMRLIVRLICRVWNVGVWSGLGWLRIGTVGGPCGCGNVISGSVEYGDLYD
jgi:hypothetical protein